MSETKGSTREAREVVAEARKAIRCLCFAVDEAVARDVDAKVSVALDILDALSEGTEREAIRDAVREKLPLGAIEYTGGRSDDYIDAVLRAICEGRIRWEMVDDLEAIGTAYHVAFLAARVLSDLLTAAGITRDDTHDGGTEMKDVTNTVQAIVNQIGADSQRERSGTQMTLGVMIEALEALPAETMIAGAAADLESYRGYYCDLAFTPGEATAGALLSECRAAMGKVFAGYKGGDYLMGETTPLWISSYGTASGCKIVGIRDGHVVT